MNWFFLDALTLFFLQILLLNKDNRHVYKVWVRFSECLLKTSNYITVWTACQRNLTFEMCNIMSIKQALHMSQT